MKVIYNLLVYLLKSEHMIILTICNLQQCVYYMWQYSVTVNDKHFSKDIKYSGFIATEHSDKLILSTWLEYYDTCTFRCVGRYICVYVKQY